MDMFTVRKNFEVFTMDGMAFLHKGLSNGAIGLLALIEYLNNVSVANLELLIELSNDPKETVLEQLAELMNKNIVIVHEDVDQEQED